MLEPRRRSSSKGTVIVLVVVLAVVVLAGLLSLTFLTKTDVSTTSNYLRELRATFLAESIVAQIDAQVNATPWTGRFWLTEAAKAGTPKDKSGSGVVPMLTLDKSSSYLDLSKDSLSDSDYDFVCQIKDLPSQLREYRIYLELTLKGEKYTFLWDKKWEQPLIVGLNRDCTLMDKPLESSGVSGEPADTFMETIKTQVVQASDKGKGILQTVLTKLRKDKVSFKAVALTPDPKTPPKDPETVQKVETPKRGS